METVNKGNKKFLYLDRFITYQIEDKKWKEDTHSIISQLETMVTWLKVGIILAIGIATASVFI